MRSASRSWALGAGSAAIAIAGAVLAVPALGASAATPRCSSGQLRLRFVDMQGAVSHRYVDFAFKNIGAGRCSLRGYPAAVLLNQHGHVIHAPRAKVTRWSLSPARTVVVKPGKRAFFTFAWVVGGPCIPNVFTFYSLRLRPPGSAARFDWHFGNTSTCDGSARISRVRPKLFPF